MSAVVVTSAEPAADRRGTPVHPVLLVGAVALLTLVPVVHGKLGLLAAGCGLLLPFVAPPAWRNRSVRLVMVTAALWLVGQLTSDAVHGLGLRASMQAGTAAAVLVLVPVLVVLSNRDDHRMRLLVAGAMLGLALEVVLVEHASVLDPHSWKFGLNDPVAVVLLALVDTAWARGRRLPSAVALAGIVVLGVVTDHRHLAAVALLTGITIFVGRRGRPRSTARVVAGILVICVVAVSAFVLASRSGLLGSRSGDQIAQFGDRPSSILVNVRPEPFQELYLFGERPGLGWGSQPQLDSSAYAGSKQFLDGLGVVRQDLDDIWLAKEDPGVSSHSQIMDSAVRGGMLALPFWIVLVALGLRAGVRAVRDSSSPLIVFWTALVVWDVFVSPLVSMSHVEVAAYLALVVSTSYRSAQRARDHG